MPESKSSCTQETKPQLAANMETAEVTSGGQQLLDATHGDQSDSQRTHARKRQDNQDARFKRFLKEYGALFGFVFVLSYVPEMLKMLPAPGGRSNLTTFSSAISVLVFGLACVFRDKIATALRSENRITRTSPVAGAICVAIAAWWLPAAYNNTYWVATGLWSEAIQTLAYLIIVPLYVLGLTIILIILVEQQASSQHIQNTVSARLPQCSNEIRDSIDNLAKFSDIARKHPVLGDIGSQQIADFRRILSDLARGRTAVPGDRVPETASELLLKYDNRLDAVSNKDVELWIPRDGDPNPAEYFKINVEAARRGTKVSRIFVFSWWELRYRLKEIAKVLRQHDEAGIGWAVALFEALPLYLRHEEAQLMDFALLNWTDGFIVFRDHRQAWRRLSIVLAVDKESRKLVRERVEIFKTLVAHCWLANKQFKENLKTVIAENRHDIGLRQKLLQEISRKQPRPAPDQAFMLEVTRPDEIDERAQEFSELARAYRRSSIGASGGDELDDLETPESAAALPKDDRASR